MLGLPEAVHACLFDLDGVLTDTASVHTKAWKVMFDAFLQQHAEQTGEPFVPFDPVDDYLKYVDGKKREDGVRSFLASRGIQLPDGDPDDSGDKDTVYGLGTRKNDAFQETLQNDGVKVFDGSRRYLEKVAAAGLATAVVSSSANTRQVLEITGLDKFIQQRVDGVTLREEHIAGKPAPDSFLRAAQLLESKRPRPQCSKTRSPEWRRGTPATSGTSSAWTGWAKPTNYAATAPTSSSPISPNCFRTHA